MKIRDLRLRLGDFQLDIPQMSLESGKIHGLIGPNGSGKTTLAKIIMGIQKPAGGALDYEGLDYRDVTMTSQRPYLLHDSVYNNLIYPLQIRKLPIVEEEVIGWLERCGLGDKRNRYARSLSSGEQQKLSFARAMIFRPKLVIVDETFSNLDPDSAALFVSWMREQQRVEPITWIMISHQLAHIAGICDQVHFLEKGKWIVSGTPDKILRNPTEEAVRRYLADTEVSFKI